MTKIDIFSGFLGAGKTTLIKKLIKEAYKGEQVVLIENEFGEIGIDGGFLADAGIKINELNSGCICCSLVGDFAKALKQVKSEYSPDRIVIEPSGVGKLSDVIRAVERAELEDCEISGLTTVVDANKCKLYMKNFGEFFCDQVETAACIVFSHADTAPETKLAEAVKLVREHNGKATTITTPLDEIDGKEIMAAIEHRDTLSEALAQFEEEHRKESEEHHHHDDDDDDDECCGHDHEHHHHHHHDGEDEDEDDDENEHHHDHDHEHHHHHHADEVFTSWGVETGKKYSAEEIEKILTAFDGSEKYGVILRAKGIVPSPDGRWLHFDYIPGETDIREGAAAYTGRVCVIGSNIDEKAIEELLGVG
ncbi:MAG: GTP-binding protein [Clostridia bacterium]|nr:GTP-binding protein [Clostridia bacterium]